jgi:ABC-type multidrug transport system ATPase subunit
VYLLDDPTRGVDIGAKQEVHDVIRSLADGGAVVIVSSSDPDELAELADRVVVFFRGRVAATLAGDDLTEHALLEAMNTGIAPVPVAATTSTPDGEDLVAVETVSFDESAPLQRDAKFLHSAHCGEPVE